MVKCSEMEAGVIWDMLSITQKRIAVRDSRAQLGESELRSRFDNFSQFGQKEACRAVNEWLKLEKRVKAAEKRGAFK